MFFTPYFTSISIHKVIYIIQIKRKILRPTKGEEGQVNRRKEGERNEVGIIKGKKQK